MTTDQAPQRYCPRCGKPEYGSLACAAVLIEMQWEEVIVYDDDDEDLLDEYGDTEESITGTPS